MEGKIYEAPPDISDSNRGIIETGPTKRVYQVWKGRNRFLLGGRLIFGPEVRSLVFTIFLIVVPVILFAAFVSPSLVGELEHDVWNIIVVMAATLTVHVLFLLFLTSSRDPGIVPRNRHPPELDDENEAANWDDFQDNAPALPPTKDVLVNGNVVKVKYCHTCMLYRPPRCSHCSICNNCVEHFDHHCPWVGQCIGKRNYRFFFMFVSSTTILCLYIFALCWVNLKKEMEEYRCNFWEAVYRSLVSAILIIYTFVAAWFVGGLTAFHMYLICTNQTTYENFRYRYDRKMNPYNRGCAANVKDTFFSRIPRSKHNFRAKVKEDLTCNSISLGRAVESDVDKTNIDLEMGGKRRAVAAEEFEEIQNQIGSMRATERSGTQPAHQGWGDQKSNWEITSDIQALSAELGMESFKGRERNH